MKTETDAIDDQIDSLQKYRDKFSDVVEDYKQGINKQITAMVLGKDWEEKVLNQRLDILNDYKDKYIGIQEAMKQAALDAANASANASTPTTGGINNPSTTTTTTTTITTTEPPVIKPENAGKVAIYKYNGQEYTSEQQANYARSQDAKAAYDEMINSTQTSGMPDSARKQNAEEMKARVMARPITKEYTEDLDYYARGGVVGKTKNGILTSLANSVGEDKMIAVKEGERILTPLQNKNFEKLVKLSEKLVPVLDNNFASNIFNSEFGKLLAIAGTGGTQTVNNTFNVTLPNINDGSKAIDLFNELQNLTTKGVQYFNGKK